MNSTIENRIIIFTSTELLKISSVFSRGRRVVRQSPVGSSRRSANFHIFAIVHKNILEFVTDGPKGTACRLGNSGLVVNVYCTRNNTH